MSNATIDRHLAGDAAEIHRHAYNAAFYELGLRWHWDTSTYQHAFSEAHERRGLRTYLETHQPHLLTAYDPEFLVDAIGAAKARCYETLTAGGAKAPPAVDWAQIQQAQVGV
jgi:hypothetical protein